MSNATKVTGLLLLLGAYSGPARAQTTYASLAQPKAAGASELSQDPVSQSASQSLKSILGQLKAKHGIQFFYSDQLVEEKLLPKARPKFGTWQEELQYVLTQSQLQYEKVADNTYVISPLLARPQAVSPIANAVAPTPVSGRVTDSKGVGLPGVTVLVQGTNNGASTNSEGAFTLDAPAGSTLVFSFVGFVTQTVMVPAGGGPLNISLLEDTQKLNEVVVVGYGTQERVSVTGAIASVSGRDIATQPVADAAQAIQGRAAGVTVTQNSGAPGGSGGTAVRVRGVTSAGNNSPLYVVDGFPLPSSDAGGGSIENQLNAINPNDIENIDVLKDASATAIYGVRAANGVVIITTKRGKAGAASISLDAYRGVQQVWRKLDLLNAEQYAIINNEGLVAAGRPILENLRDPKKLGAGTDWQSAVFRPTAVIQSYNLTARGGGEKAQYAVAGGYFQQDGTLNGSTFERFTLRANGDVRVSNRVKIGNSLSITHLTERQIDTGNNEFGVLNNVLQAPPTLAAYNPDGSWHVATPEENYSEPNPIIQSLIENKKFTRNRLLSTFFGEVEPLDGLHFRTNVGADLVFDESRQFLPSLGPDVPRYNVASASANSAYNPGWLIENTLTYDRTIAAKHHFTVLLGQSAQRFSYNNIGAYRVGYLANDLQQLNNGPSTPGSQSNNGTTSRTQLASYFARVNYEFAGKYLLTGIVRRDGSSAFGPGSRFGTFPAVSVGWRLSEEDFVKNLSAFSNLKLRVGYGRVGNPLNAGQFAYLATINNGIRYPFGATSATGNQTTNAGAVPTRAQNANLRWEDNIQTNVGLDVGLLDGRVEATIDVYNRRSPNLLVNVPAYFVTGTYESVPTNSLSARNRGLDLALTTRNLTGEGGRLSWTTTAIFSTYSSRIEDLGQGVPAFNGVTTRDGAAIVRYDVGQSFGAFYGYVADGLFQAPEELTALNANAVAKTGDPAAFYQSKLTAPGDLKFKDLNGDGVVNADDRTFIGNPNPAFTYSLNNTVAWKGFDLNVFLQGSQGNDVYNLNRVYTEGGLYGNVNSSTRVLSRWTGPGTSTDVPRAAFGDPNNNLRVSSYFIEDGSYLRVKTLTLGYSLPANLIRHVAAKTLRVYVTGQNLLTLTRYTGFDPEVGGAGLDRGIYPQSRVLLAGLNVGF